MDAAHIPLIELSAADLQRTGVTFSDGTWVYSTTGKCLGQGGSGTAWLVTRWHADDPTDTPEPVVAKTFRDEFLILVREDEAARRHFEHNLGVVERINQIAHPGLVPMLMVAPIADNYLFLSPLVGESLQSYFAGRSVGARHRVQLLLDALQGLAALHDAGIVHRDFTLNNILTSGDPIGPGLSRHASLFDYDLAVAPEWLPEPERSWEGYSQGRIAGSPEYSVAPEMLDEVLMAHPISPRADVYAVGTALWATFTSESLYGEPPDLPTLLFRISEGIVHRGESMVLWPDEIPQAVRPIVATCLERDPSARFADAGAVVLALESVLSELPAGEGKGRYRMTLGYVHPERKQRQDAVFATRLDESVTFEEVRRMDVAMGNYGYVLEQSLGRVKGHPIFLAFPDPQLLQSGQFPEDNPYRKIVTGIDVASRPDGAEFVETWLGRIRPIVDRVRQGLLTSLYKAVHDKESGQLLLFSEYISEPRFGTELNRLDIALEEAFALGLLVAQPIARLHAEGLAHNNVRPSSLLFKGRRDTGEVRPVLVGLVEPTFVEAAREEDVRNLARLVAGLIRQPRIDALHPELRRPIEGLRDDLEGLVRSEFRTPTIGMLVDAIAGGLGVVEPNFEIVRVHGGDIHAYADLLIRHSLYHKLYE